MFEQLEFSG